MKKYLSVICALFLLISAVSCGNTETSASTENNTVEETETSTEEITELETEELTNPETKETETELIIEEQLESVTETVVYEESDELTAEEVTEFLTEEITDNISNTKEYTAEDIIQYFKENNAPDLGEYIIRTEDDERFLGRPGYFTSKVSFRIESVEYDERDPYDGSIQVYDTEEDAQKNYDTYKSLLESMPYADEYMVIIDRTILRIKFDVVPSKEEVYEQLLNSFLNEP